MYFNLLSNCVLYISLSIYLFRLESDCTQELHQKQEEQQLFDRLHSQLLLPDLNNQSQSSIPDSTQSQSSTSESDQSHEGSPESDQSQDRSPESDQSQDRSPESDQSQSRNSRVAFEECHKILDEAESTLREKIVFLKDITAKEKELLQRIEVNMYNSFL